MGTIVRKIKLILISCTIFSSCSDEVLEQPILSTSPIKKITFFTKPFVPANESRTTIDITDNNVREYWNNTDTIGVFPLKGAQSYFPLVEGDNLSSATFTGAVWKFGG